MIIFGIDFEEGVKGFNEASSALLHQRVGSEIDCELGVHSERYKMTVILLGEDDSFD